MTSTETRPRLQQRYRDAIVPPENGKLLADLLPHCRYMLLDGYVALEDLWGAAGAELAERLAAAPGLDAALAVLAGAIARRMPPPEEIDPLVRAAALGATRPRTTVERLGPDAGQVLGALKDRLDGYKVPKSVIVTDELPRTSTGKIQKNIVRDTHADHYTDGSSSPIGVLPPSPRPTGGR